MRAGDDGFCPHGVTAGIGCSECERRREEYDVCQRRGHEPSGTAITVGWTTFQRCKWCATSYHVEVMRIVHESDKPYGVDDDE